MGWLELRKDTGKYRFCWKENGRTRKKNLKTSKRSIALRHKRILEGKMEMQGFLRDQSRSKKISDVLELYLDYKKNLVAEKSLTNYRSITKRLISFFRSNNILDIDKLSAYSVNDFVNSRYEDGASNKTISDDLIFLKSVIKFAIQSDIIDKDPVRFYPAIKKKLKSPERVGIYSNEDIATLKKHIAEKQPEFYDLFIFLIYTGCRLTEALKLQKMQINFEENKISLRNYKTEIDSDTAYRHIEIHDALLQILKNRCELIENTDLIFSEAQKHSREWTRRELIKACNATEVAYKRVHGLRHTWITKLLNENVPPTQVQNMAGHRKLDTTMKYYKFVNAEAAGKINRINY